MWKKQRGGQWLTEHFRVQGTAVLKENSDDLHLIAEKPGASAARAGQQHRRAPAPLGCHLQRAVAICSALPQTHRKLIFWQNTGINMTFKQVVCSQAEHGRRAKLKLHTCPTNIAYFLCTMVTLAQISKKYIKVVKKERQNRYLCYMKVSWYYRIKTTIMATIKSTQSISEKKSKISAWKIIPQHPEKLQYHEMNDNYINFFSSFCFIRKLWGLNHADQLWTWKGCSVWLWALTNLPGCSVLSVLHNAMATLQQ